MFNNNNYLPDLNHFPPTGQQQQQLLSTTDAVGALPVAPQFEPPRQLAPPAIPPVSCVGLHGNFRFLSPTQVTAAPTWIPAASVLGTQSAPGMGTSWQHSVPMTMPWANHTVPHFSADVTPVRSMPVYTMSASSLSQTIQMQTTPRLSVRCVRMKRRLQPNSPDDPDSPSSKRYLSEKMAHWFNRLQIGPSKGDNHCHSLEGTSSQQGGPPMLDNGWQRFHEVEKRLGEDVDTLNNGDLEMAAALGQSAHNGVGGGSTTPIPTPAATTTTSSSSFSCPGGMSPALKNGGVVLEIPEELRKEVHNPEPVLPTQIMKTITNPCMDLVLWKPPEAIITQHLSPEAGSLSISDPSHTSSSSSSSNNVPCSNISSNISSMSSIMSRCPNRLAASQTTSGNSPACGFSSFSSSSSPFSPFSSPFSSSSSSFAAQQQQQQLLLPEGGWSGSSGTSFGSFVSGASGLTEMNGSKASMEDAEFFDCMDTDDDMDL